MTARTIGAIALRPTGNAQGGHYFYSLVTGRRVIRNQWTELPMPGDVIIRIQRMAENSAVNRLVFGDRQNTEMNEEGYDSENDDDDPTREDSGSEDEADPDDDLHGTGSGGAHRIIQPDDQTTAGMERVMLMYHHNQSTTTILKLAKLRRIRRRPKKTGAKTMKE